MLRATELLDRRTGLLDRTVRGDAENADLAEVSESLDAILRLDMTVRPLSLTVDRELVLKLADAERVHPVTDEVDLRDRFDVDRRVFVMEHPALPGRALTVVWVALRVGVADRLAQILDPELPVDDPAVADTAMLYSIWNVEPGIRGLGRARELLTRVIEQVRSEQSGITNFATLSPIPGLRRWLGETDPEKPATAPETLLRSCARYLSSFSPEGVLLDPVARFHMGNGARLLRICADADPSPQGSQQSFALMANYRYEPEDLAANRSELAAGTLAIGDQIRALLGTE